MTDQNQSLRNARFSISYVVLTVTFCVCLIMANIMEVKTISIGSVTLTAGMIVFPLSYIINDCLVEIYGLRKASVAIFMGFAMNFLAVIFMQIAIALPGDGNWIHQGAMEALFGAAPRILFASFSAFLIGSFTNAYVMARMKAGDDSNSGSRFGVRAIVSTIFGEGMDSLVFFPIAFGGVLPTMVIVGLIMAQTLLKTLYEIIILPVTILVVQRLRKIESDQTDFSASA